jgi:two-component system sensor histidine kinase BaeS
MRSAIPLAASSRLSARVVHGHSVLAVSDSGSGIAAEHLPYVFDRFYKADPARAARTEGSGLGLSIARAIVERHGGTIDVASAPGRTTFTIRLPQRTGMARETREASQPASTNL